MSCARPALTDRAAAQHGISAFLVEKGTPGYRTGKKENKLGLRASATGEVIFESCRLGPQQLLGKLNGGFVDSLIVLDGGRVVEDGTHDELVAAGRGYAKLFTLQAQGYL